jgi:hypothetical protein
MRQLSNAKFVRWIGGGGAMSRVSAELRANSWRASFSPYLRFSPARLGFLPLGGAGGEPANVVNGSVSLGATLQESTTAARCCLIGARDVADGYGC